MAEVTIEATPNGPYLVTGPVELRDTDGKILPTKGKVWLCRCGASTKKPLCDGTHSKIGLQAAAQAVPGSAVTDWGEVSLTSPIRQIDVNIIIIWRYPV